MKLLEILLEPDKPLWLKIGVAVVLVAGVAAWWAQDYWQGLHTPDDTSDKRKARPPF